jgi:ABC-type sugar transport system ATPase subunit
LPPLLEVRSLTVPGRLRVDRLEVRSGEVIGLAGLVGAGRSRLLRTIAGLETPAQGRMAIDGAEVKWPVSPRKALTMGIALAPEDRRTQGLILGQLSWINMTVSTVARPSSLGVLRRRAAEVAARTQAAAVNLAENRLEVSAGTLSGGNQQKVVLGRLVGLQPRLLLVDEPMRGIDVGAREEIFRVIEAATAQGTAVVIASEETEDLLSFCDRVIVMRRGVAVAELSGLESRDAVYAAMLGAPTTSEPSEEIAS